MSFVGDISISATVNFSELGSGSKFRLLPNRKTCFLRYQIINTHYCRVDYSVVSELTVNFLPFAFFEMSTGDRYCSNFYYI